MSHDVAQGVQGTIQFEFGRDDVEGSIGSYQTTADEEGHLHHVGPSHGSQTTVDGVSTRDEEEQENDDQQCHVDLHAQQDCGSGGQAQNLFDGQCAQPSHGGQVDEYIEEEPEDGESQTHAPVVAFTQELGNSEYLAFNHHRQQELCYDNQGCCSHQLVGCHGNT